MAGLEAGAVRALAASGAVAAYLAMCGMVLLSHRRRRDAARKAAVALAPAPAGVRPMLVAFASQTGHAEELAWHAARSLHDAGVPSRVVALADLGEADLRQAERALFVASTCGEGDAPDHAAPFVRSLMTGTLALDGLRYGLLALGDRSYANFCGFGRTLDAWLAGCGAQTLFERVDVDNGDEAALREWRRRLAHAAGTSDLPEWQAPAYSPWRIVRREHLNAGSAGGPTFHVELQAPPDAEMHWESGDLLQVLPPGDPQRAREYSIASVPADGRVHLLVRQERRDDGSLGAASGWLTQEAPEGAEVMARLRAHKSFRLGDNAARPIIFIGNGTGLAGLRGHLKKRAAEAWTRNWLIFGERHAACDYYHREEIEAWRESGVIERLDLAFSRDQPERRYVQHVIRESAGAVRSWLDAGAAVYVCGSLVGMAGEVEAALIEIAGADAVQRLIEEGRIRRDVY